MKKILIWIGAVAVGLVLTYVCSLAWFYFTFCGQGGHGMC